MNEDLIQDARIPIEMNQSNIQRTNELLREQNLEVDSI